MIDAARGQRKKVLLEQYEAILHYGEFRAAIVHGMWDYEPHAPSQIKTVRIKKKQIITTTFPPDSLLEFIEVLQEINFKIRNPGGWRDHAKTMAEQGLWMSRSFVAMMTGDDPMAEELLPAGVREVLRADVPEKK